MKNISRFILITIGASLCAVSAIRAEDFNPDCAACQKRHARAEQFKEKARHRGEKLAQQLGLTAEQQAHMKALAGEQRTAARALRDDPALTPEQRQEKIRQLRQDFKARRQAYLTPEQQKKAAELRAAHQAKRAHRAPKAE